MEARVFNDVVLKLDGNPYHPFSTEPHLDYATDPKDAAKVEIPHSLCPRGQAGLQTLYDPYRITKPLKRVGPRGSGKFKTISWEQLIEETVNGGYLFKDVPGEENRLVEGFTQLWDNGNGRLTPFDRNHPDIGPKTNQLIMYWGRAETGQKDFIRRFAGAFGSVNALQHVGICELNHHVATAESLNGKIEIMKPDLEHSEYVIWFGAGIYTANFPMQTLARKTANAFARGMKFVIVDVNALPSVAHADRFVAVKPGGDGALAMGMIRWIIEKNRYDERFLSIPNVKSANQSGEPNYSNVTYLVIVDPNHEHAFKFARARDVGLADAKSKDAEKYVVLDANGKAQIYDQVGQARLWPNEKLNVDPITAGNVKCQTSFQILYQSAKQYTIEEYAKQAGITENVIAELAKEFTSYGKKAVADFYRGPAMHTNGFYNSRAIMTLNFLIGNIDWEGGYMKGGSSGDYLGKSKDALFNLASWPNQPKKVPNGVKISREGSAYEETSLYKELKEKGQSPFPAKRPWFPFGFGIWHEIFAGMWDAYPYPAKIVYQHMGNPAYSAPPGMGGILDENLPWFRLVKDLKKVPLFIVDDIVLGESAMYADYIVPDSTYLEAWGVLGGSATVPTAVSGVRQPVVEPLMAKTADGRPMCFETYLIDVAEKLKMPGFGENAFEDGGKLHRREDYYLRMIANVAYDTGTFKKVNAFGKLEKTGVVPDGTDADMKSVERWKKNFGDVLTEAQWRKVAYIMARGGRFEVFDAAYHGEKPGWLTYRYGGTLQIYNETVATAHNAISGELFHGTAIAMPQRTIKGRLLDEIYPEKEFPYFLSTYKLPIHTQSRTISDSWLVEMLPENFIEINMVDAKQLNIKNGDLIRVISATYPNGIAGRARVMNGVRPGVITFSNSFGHWKYGSGKWSLDGKTIAGDDSRNGGVRLNAMVDADGWGTCLQDPVGGGASYFDTRVKIVKV